MSRLAGMRRGHVLRRAVLVYLIIGLAYASVTNLAALISDKPTAFAWAGSLTGQAILLVFWFLVPALTWPYELAWTFAV